MNEAFMRLLSRFSGYARVRIITPDPERFFNTLLKENIPIWSVSSDGLKVYFNVRLSDMDEIWKIGKIFDTNVVIEERFGAVKWINVISGYRFPLILFFLVFVMFMYVSGFVWNVNIYGARLTDEESLRMFLYDNGYKSSMSKEDVGKTDIELLIKSEFENITEVVTDIDGVNLNITVFESESPIIAFDKDTPVDIVATKDCIIDEIDVYNGTAMVKAGDEVKKGDVLISGRREYYFRDEKRIKNVHAIGKTLSYEKVYYDNIYVDMYVPDEDAPYASERIIYLFGKAFTYLTGDKTDGNIRMEMKNLQISIGWLNIPILYDEIRWYNIDDCTLRSDEEIYEDVYASLTELIGNGYTIRSMSYAVTATDDYRLKVSVEADCAVNVGIEREIF